MTRWKNAPLNSGGVLALGLGFEFMKFASDVYRSSLFGFLCLGWLGLTGLYYGVYSLEKFGLWIRAKV